MRVVGVDYGLRRIGLALSDPTRIIASPFATVEAAKTLSETVQRLINAWKDEEVDLIVIGMPYHLDGRLGTIGEEIQKLIPLLEQAQPFPVITWDERFTTALAERVLREGGMRRKKRAKVVDKVSAALLLQSYLDSLTPL